MIGDRCVRCGGSAYPDAVESEMLRRYETAGGLILEVVCRFIVRGLVEIGNLDVKMTVLSECLESSPTSCRIR